MLFSNLLLTSLHEQTVGQDYAVAALTRAVTLAMAGIRHRNGVLGSLLFIGPPSSGKNHMARVLSNVLNSTRMPMICINCRQTAQEELRVGPERALISSCLESRGPLISNLLPPVIAFEDVDKATASFRDELALSIDRGSIHAMGMNISLMNSFVILICELSRRKTDQLAGRTIGFFFDGETEAEMSRRQAVALEEVDARLGPRLVSRIDEIVVFDRLNQQGIITLLERQILEIECYLARFCIGLITEPEAKTFLLKGGLEDLNHGARQISRMVRNYLEFPLSDLILSRRLVPGTTAIVRYSRSKSFLDFEIMTPTLPLPNWRDHAA